MYVVADRDARAVVPAPLLRRVDEPRRDTGSFVLVRRADEADEEARVAEVALRLPLGGVHRRLERRLDVSGDFPVDLGDAAEVFRLRAPVVVVLDQFDEATSSGCLK